MEMNYSTTWPDIFKLAAISIPFSCAWKKKCNTACRMKSYASELIKGNVRENRKLENELHVSFPGVYSEEKVQRSLDAMKGRRDNLIQVDVFSLEFY